MIEHGGIAGRGARRSRPVGGARSHGRARAHATTALLLGLGLGLGGGLSACVAPLPALDETPDAALPTGVSVRILQGRFDYATRTLQVSVTNDGLADLDLRDVTVVSPLFTTPASYTDDLVLSPGMTRNLPVALTAPVCTGTVTERDTGTADSATVVLTWREPDGDDVQASVTPLDDTGAIARISAEDCLNEAVKGVATIAASDELRLTGDGPGAVAWLDLVIAPTGAAGTLMVSAVGGTVLLAGPSGGGWPVGASVSAASDPLIASLDLRPTRCDPHAVAEDKRGTVFPVDVSVEGGDLGRRAGAYDVAVSDGVRSQIYAWIAQYCAS